MSYTETVVEGLMPAVWDRSFAWGLQNPYAPDEDMPKMKYKSPKEATTFWTHLIDIRMAWERSPLTSGERRALLLHYGFGWTAEEIGFNQGVTPRAINKRLTKGVECMAKWLNAEGEVE